MSDGAVMEFLKKVDGDPDLREKLERALDDEGNAVASFLATAEEEGFQFTADEFLEVVQSRTVGDERAELSDDDLEAVAGGLTFGAPPMRRMVARVSRTFGGLRAGPGIRGIGPSEVMLGAQEEEDSPA